MSLSNEEKNLIVDHISAFAMKMILSGGCSEKEIHADLDNFFEFFCGALEAAKRDARREVLTTTLN